MSPLCESILSANHLDQMEPFYPLHTYVCEQCFLVQLEEYVSPEEIFTVYNYSHLMPLHGCNMQKTTLS